MTQQITTAARREARTETTSSRTRAMLTCGVVAGPVFLAVALVLTLTRDGFDLSRHPISALSLGDDGWIQRANFVFAGVLTGAFALGVRRALHGKRGGTWGSILLGTYGIGLIIAGIVVADPAFGFPPGSPDRMPEHLTEHAEVHGIGFMLALGSVTAAALVFARRFAGLGQRAWTTCSIATAVAGVVLGAWPGRESASLRYAVATLVVWAWMTALAARVLRETDT